MRDRKINELAAIDFSSGPLGEAFRAYGEEAYALGRRWARELDMAATDSKAAMETLKGHPLLFGLDCWAKARRVAYRLRRAQNLADGLAQESRKFHRAYERHFLAAAK